LVSAALLALVVGCDTAPADDNGRTPDLSAPSSANTTRAQSAEDQVIAAYNEYWTRSHQVPHRPLGEWDEAMAEVAVNPQLKTTLQGMKFARRDGVTSYGEVTARIQDVKIDGKRATVVDCQDASKSGQADLKTGKKRTVGVARNPVEARLKIDSADGAWKVSKITFAGGDC